MACLWVDEFNQHYAECADAASFAAAHAPFVEKRSAKLAAEAAVNPRKWAQLLAMPAGFQSLPEAERHQHFARLLRDAALALHHRHHSIDPHSHKHISFGLIRMANIAPLYEVALALFQLGAPQGVRIHLCVYHSQFPLFARSAIEQRLDATLNRRSENAVFDLPEIRHTLDAHAEANQLFIVLGSPVTEVGRDHDYDWAVVEPSSMRSLIQLAGRVLRHRTSRPVDAPNILICESNLRHFGQPGNPAFCRPGFESLDFPLQPHNLQALLSHVLDAELRFAIDARPRILPRGAEQRSASGNLVDLEHTRMEAQMLPPAPVSSAASGHRRKSRATTADAPAADSQPTAPPRQFNASTFWHWPTVQLTGALQQSQVFRQDGSDYVDVVMRPTENEDGYLLYRVAEGEKKWEQLYVLVDGALLHRIADSAVNGPGIAPWGNSDFWQAMQTQAEAMELSVHDFATRYATASLRASTQGWRWHPALGFTAAK